MTWARTDGPLAYLWSHATKGSPLGSAVGIRPKTEGQTNLCIERRTSSFEQDFALPRRLRGAFRRPREFEPWRGSASQPWPKPWWKSLTRHGPEASLIMRDEWGLGALFSAPGWRLPQPEPCGRDRASALAPAQLTFCQLGKSFYL